MNEKMLAEMMVENERRKARNSAYFDPISGEGSVGPRFRIVRNGIALRVPETMKEHRDIESMPEERFERLRMKHDFPYWAAKYAYIKTKGGGEDSLFVLNRPQRILVERLEEIRRAKRPIRLLLLKARQWGGSTCIQIYMAWLQLVHEVGLNSLIIAHQRTATDEIKDMFDRLIKQYPDHLLLSEETQQEKAGKRKGKKKKTERVGGADNSTRLVARKCKIKVGSAERPDSCRGGDYNLVHCSEVGIWKATPSKTPEDIARAATAGVLLDPMTMIVYESTANGTGNFFHREYEAAKRGVSQFEALFISWSDIDLYTLPLSDPKGFAASLLANKDSEGTDSDRRQSGKYLWWLWERGATLEAIAWYVAERAKYADNSLMAAEYPSDDVEAFAHSGTRVFDRTCVEALRAGCRPPLATGEIDSELLPMKGLYPNDDYRIRQLRRARFTSGMGAWQLWSPPGQTPGFESRYVVVVDVGGRSDKADWSVIAIFDRAPMLNGGMPEIVAQWRGHTDFDILAWRAALGASLFDDALLVIESNSIETRDPNRVTEGDQTFSLLSRLRDIYPNLYRRRRRQDEIHHGKQAKYGFHTNVATKQLVISTLVEAIREGLYVERDETCIDEFLSYERRPDGSLGALSGTHDDLLMTRAIGLHIIFHELDLPTPSRLEAHIKSSSAPTSYASHSFPSPSSFASW